MQNKNKITLSHNILYFISLSVQHEYCKKPARNNELQENEGKQYT